MNASDLFSEHFFLEFFEAEACAGSRVTAADEAQKAQITVTKTYEQPVLFSVYPNIPTGKKETLGDSCLFEFRSYPTGRRIKLPLLRRWDRPGEIRLYMRAGDFRPQADDYWFMFRRSDELWIGALSETEIQGIRQSGTLDTQNSTDGLVEDSFQSLVNSDPKLITRTSTTFLRDPKVSRFALENSGFKCELRPDIETFTARATGHPYLEAHHFFPIFEQRNFPECSLDVPQNICILNPLTHRMLHHGRPDEIAPMLDALFHRREEFFNGIGVTRERILQSYGALNG